MRPVSTSTFGMADAQFPPWKQVIPSTDRPQGKCVGVNPRYFADLVLVQEAEGSGCGARINFGDALDPIHCQIGAWVVVIMPMRI